MTTKRKQSKITKNDLKSWDLLKKFKQALKDSLMSKPDISADEDSKRKLKSVDYFCSIVFTLFNPVIDSMRGFCEASKLKKVQEKVCSRKVSLGSFSEAQSVFDPEILHNIMKELAETTPVTYGNKKVIDAVGDLIAVDGSLLHALPRMYWALWQDDQHRAAKVHLKFSIMRQVPVEAPVTEGKSCERKALKKCFNAGEFYVCDRYYGLDYSYFSSITAAKADFAIRIRNNPIITIIENYDLTPEDEAEGIIRDQLVKLGKDQEHDAIRLVTIKAFDGKEILVVTSKSSKDLPAELVSIIYRHRWQIELFFKWIKCILGYRHMLAESRKGVAIQLYCALIVAILLFRLTGRKPSKRDMEIIKWYFCGMASLEELTSSLKIESL